GGHVDASITDGVALLPSVLLADLTARLPVAAQGYQTFLGGGLACYDVYRLKDGYAAVGALEANFWEALCRILGRPELIALHSDLPAQPKVRAALAASFGELCTADIGALGLEEHACVSVVRRYEDLVSASEAMTRGTVVAAAAGFAAPGLPFRIDGAVVSPPSSAPLRGEHTLEVLAELEVDERDVAALLATGVVQCTRSGERLR
ncbi:CoA transferase, partial [Mycolicibacterium sp.]